MTAYSFTLMTHLALGGAALLSYWVAALARKGSKPHKLAGKIYLLTMIGLLIPAIPLSLRAALFLSSAFGAFLFYLLLITVTALWQGWFASRHKRDFARYTGPGYRRLAWMNLVAGAAVLALGAVQVNPVFMGFSLVGLLGGAGMLRLARRGPSQPRWWLSEHYGAMLGAGVATHIAFLSLGLPRLLPGLSGPTLQNIAWLGPLVAALLARVWLNRRYRASTILPVSTTVPAGRSVPA
ncbi:hypothetical protein BH11PSE14_BH11PSE14_04440 [soil metagenome]